jgi:cyclophilin family peptidyl-prolyl cis-trans isomerase
MCIQYDAVIGQEVFSVKKIIVGFFILTLCCGISAYAKQTHKKFTKQEINKMSTTKAIIETKFGNITLKFFPDVAPGHVKNFIDLAKKGFYDGTTFHRVIPGFMIQGGDPNSKNPDKRTHGMGGPGYTIKAEFNDRPHKRGTLSMARSQNPDSAGSQFFICVKDAPFLDHQYTVFGEVESGMEAVDKIVSQPRDQNDNPNERIEMKVKIEEGK